MKLFLLNVIGVHPWGGRYDTAHGFVIRADSEERARLRAHESGGDENRAYASPWLDPDKTSCRELTADGIETVVLMDFNAG